MKRFSFLIYGGCAAMLLLSCRSQSTFTAQELPLKQVVGKEFLIGAALNQRQVEGGDSLAAELVAKHFNSIVAENCMKCEAIHPAEKEYNFGPADAFVRFGKEHHMHIVGHCLIWHSQLAPWFAVGKDGGKVTAEELKQRMKDHIYTIVKRYKGVINGWDVVNEAILEDGSFRPSIFYEVLGEEYISLAFRYAHEADPKAELYYNDYGMDRSTKREAVVKLVNKLKSEGLRIDAIGMQSHMGMDYPNIEEFEKSIEAYATTGCKVMITEWDMSALPTLHQSANIADTVAFNAALNPFPNGLSEEVSAQWNRRMSDFFQLFRKHADVISRVTAWGVTDGDSWKNDWPMAGRKEYPLLFDRNYQPKPFIQAMILTK